MANHGHDGMLRNGLVANYDGLEVLTHQALAQAQKRVDTLAPSDEGQAHWRLRSHLGLHRPHSRATDALRSQHNSPLLPFMSPPYEPSQQ